MSELTILSKNAIIELIFTRKEGEFFVFLKKLNMALFYLVIAGSATTMAAEYTVRPGDTLTGIASSTSNSVACLKAMNSMTNDTIIVEHKLFYVDRNDMVVARQWLVDQSSVQHDIAVFYF